MLGVLARPQARPVHKPHILSTTSGNTLSKDDLVMCARARPGNEAALVDSNATGDYEVEKALSFKGDGTTYGELESAITLTGAYTITFDLMRSATDSAEQFFDGDFEFILDASGDITSQTYITSVTVDGTVATSITDTDPRTVVITGTSTGQTLDTVGSDSAHSTIITSNIANLHIEDSTGVIFSNFLAQGGDEALCVSQVGPNVVWQDYTDSPYGESIEYGHEWSNYSNVENLLEQSRSISFLPTWVHSTTVPTITKDGATAPDGSMTADLIDISAIGVFAYQLAQRVLTPGDSITFSQWIKPIGGTVCYRALYDVTNASWILSNAAYPDLVDGEWNFVEDTVIVPAGCTEMRIYPFRSYNSQSIGSLSIWGTQVRQIGSAGYYPSEDNIIVGKIPADPDSPTLDVFGNALTNAGTPQQNISVIGYAAQLDGSESLTLDLVGTETAVVTGTTEVTISADTIDFTAGWCSRIVLSDGTDLVLESAKDSEQGAVYDISDNSNHANLNDATVGEDGIWTAEVEGSKLFADGFQLSSGNYVPARADGLSALGQTLTNAPAQLEDAPILLKAPESKTVYQAMEEAGLDEDFYLDGDAIGLTPAAWLALAGNPLFYSTAKNAIALYNPEPDAETETEINDYLGITT